MSNKIIVFELQHRKGGKFQAILCDAKDEVLESVVKFLDLAAGDGEQERSLKIIRLFMTREDYDALPDWDKGK